MSHLIRLIFFVALLLLTSCLQNVASPATPLNVRIPVVLSPTPEDTAGVGLFDASELMSGICFEAAFDAAGQVFVLRSAEEHIRFYDLADNSQLCRQPVERFPFDFSEGDVLAGLWSSGTGCTARHDILSYLRDDTAKTIRIQLQLVIEGNCNYELIRPYWVGLESAADYDVVISVLQ